MANCPICETKAKLLKYSFYRCPADGLVFNIEAKALSYDKDYFQKDYQKQYGKTYLEDKENIQKRNLWRLKLFQKFAPAPKARLLEIGCAYGFFLELAQKSGFSVEGWEISAEAAQFCQKKGLFVKKGDFFTLYQAWKKKKNPPFDIVAAFYTVEHFAKQREFWEIAQELLNRQGFLLLSLPSTFGPMFFFHRENWYKTHPEDHFADYSPKSLAKIGKRYGFKLLLTKAEGIHPARFPGGSFPLLQNFYRKIQEYFSFSDTVYAILKKTGTGKLT